MNSVEGSTPQVVEPQLRGEPTLDSSEGRRATSTTIAWLSHPRIVVRSNWTEMTLVVMGAAAVSLIVSVLLSSLS